MNTQVCIPKQEQKGKGCVNADWLSFLCFMSTQASGHSLTFIIQIRYVNKTFGHTCNTKLLSFQQKCFRLLSEVSLSEEVPIFRCLSDCMFLKKCIYINGIRQQFTTFKAWIPRFFTSSQTDVLWKIRNYAYRYFRRNCFLWSWNWKMFFVVNMKRKETEERSFLWKKKRKTRRKERVNDVDCDKEKRIEATERQERRILCLYLRSLWSKIAFCCF